MAYPKNNHSLAQRIWAQLRSRDAYSTFALTTLTNSLTRADTDVKELSNKISKNLSKMTKEGLFVRLEIGKYQIQPKFFDWGNSTKFHKARAKPPQRKVYPSKKIRRESWRVPAIPDKTLDVIENLLTAMAEAEPELRRLMEQDKAIRKLARGE